MTGAIVAQFFVLSNDSLIDSGETFHRAGKSLAAIFVGSAGLVVVIGGLRYLRQQSSILIARHHTGGLDLWAVFVLSALVRPSSSIWKGRK